MPPAVIAGGQKIRFLNTSSTFPGEGRRRVVIENVIPAIDAGSFPIKRTVGERVVVEADIFADGHDSLAAVLQFRPGPEAAWSETPMRLVTNDRWRGYFEVRAAGHYQY